MLSDKGFRCILPAPYSSDVVSVLNVHSSQLGFDSEN
jgi:hypothetical protein